MNALLSFENVWKRYGQRAVLSDVSLEIPSSVIGLVGPNGAGKSTLMKIILGFLAFEGEARVLGLDPRTQAMQLRAKLGYMPERDGLPTGMTAVDVCTLGGALCGLPRQASIERAHATLGFVGLGDKRYQSVDGYSTGMKQRVRLAVALVHGPELLLLDEPTNGLDPAGREEMLQLIAQIPKRAGASVILSSHLLPDIESVCDRALVLDDGKVVFSGALATLRGNDSGPRKWEIRTKGDAQALADELQRLGYAIMRSGSSLHVTATTDPSTKPIFAAAQRTGSQIRQLLPAHRGLEAAFLDAVGAA